MSTEIPVPPHDQAPPDQSDGPAQQRIVHIPFPESFVYANCAAFASGEMDIRLAFAEAMPDGTAVPKVGIVMPPETAAVIALVLFQQVRTYEKNFGEIRHPMWKTMKAGFAPNSPYIEPKNEGE